ncbi:hypothetical protein CDD81_120 [Ophiocordyceps australis]|uniref:Peptidase M60 domain-containing protein n=1 Tax=Ophiocordyceps australis TaxID=1399860 RepID=A0A2C5YK14_9HYPO|nr:hypothetical protein CDD81_120 [Ophiocordyceps australis]
MAIALLVLLALVTPYAALPLAEEAVIFSQPRSIELRAMPDAQDEKQRLRHRSMCADFQPTGFYLPPSVGLKIRVSGVDAKGAKLELLVGLQPSVTQRHDAWIDLIATSLQVFGPFEDGHHFISGASELQGIIYLRYTYPAGQDRPRAANVTLDDSPVPFPFYRQGVTTDQEWMAMLKATRVPYAEMSGKHVIVSGLAHDARRHAERGQKQHKLLESYSRIMQAQDALSALSPDAPDARDRSSPLRLMVVQCPLMERPCAFDYGVCAPEGHYMWDSSFKMSFWPVWHELGHHRELGLSLSWEGTAEASASLYGVAVARSLGFDDWLNYAIFDGNAWNRLSIFFVQDALTDRQWANARAFLDSYFITNETAPDFDRLDSYVQLFLYEQLRVAFGPDFWPRMHKAARRAPIIAPTISPPAHSPQDTTNQLKHFFATQAANLAGVDLTDFFAKWRLNLPQSAIHHMQRLPKPTQDYAALKVGFCRQHPANQSCAQDPLSPLPPSLLID